MYLSTHTFPGFET